MILLCGGDKGIAGGETSNAQRRTGATGTKSSRTTQRRSPTWNAALGEGDPRVLLLALRDVARTREGGLAGLAEQAQLDREPRDRMLAENGNPELRSLEALLGPSASV